LKGLAFPVFSIIPARYDLFAMVRPLDLYAELREGSRVSKKTGQRVSTGAFQISITAPKRLFNTDDKQIGKIYGAAVAQHLRDSISKGASSDGRSLPGLSDETLERRDERYEQGLRGGAPPKRKDGTPRIDDAEVKKVFAKRHTFNGALRFPTTGKPRGNVTGILVDSIRAVARSDGRGFLIFVAANRSKPQNGERISALQSVLQSSNVWTARASVSDAMVSAREAVSAHMRGAAKREILKLISNLKGIQAEMEKISDK
jgi:hypothetical protein